MAPRLAFFLLSCGLAVTPSIAQAAPAHSQLSASRSVAGPSLATNDFDIALTPSSSSVAPGLTRKTVVSTTLLQGSAETLTMSATGQPTGVTTSFGNATITAGNSTSLTFNVAAGTAFGTYPITVKATGPSANHSIDYSLTVAPVNYLTVNDVTVGEGGGTATLTVTRTGTTTAAASVDVGTVSRTATSGSDFTATTGTLQFAANQTTATQTVPILEDGIGEPDETLALILSNPVGATISDDTGVVTITDNDAATYFSVSDTSVSEGNSGSSLATFTVTRSGNTSAASSVMWTTNNLTAQAPGDYTSVPTSKLDFAIGDTTKTVTVSVLGDTVGEADETFGVRIFTPVNGVISDDLGTATILDDDAPASYSINDISTAEGDSGTHTATFTITRTNSSGTGRVTVSTANGTATSGRDYTALTGTPVNFANGDLSKTVNVTVVSDTANEPNETFLLNLTAPVNGTIADASGLATILDDDAAPYFSVSDEVVTEGNASNRTVHFTVTRSGDTSAPVSVRYITASGTASDRTTTRTARDFIPLPSTLLNFGVGVTSQTVDVTVVADTTKESNERFSLKLATPVGAVISDGVGTATIVDDDVKTIVPGPTTFLTIKDLSVSEGAGNATFTVARSGSRTGVSKVTVATVKGTAIPGSDFTTVAATRLVFNAGVASQTVTVPILQDTTDEPDENFSLKLSSPTGATVSDYVGVATIVDDDPTTYVSISDASMAEGNTGTTNMVFTLTRSGTTNPATVFYTTKAGTATAGSDFTATTTAATVNFAAGIGTATVTVPIVGDAIREPNENFTVNLTAAPGTTLSDASGVGTIINDDAASYVSVSDASTVEGNTGSKTVNVTFTRSGPLTNAATFSYATVSGGNATAGADYTAIPVTTVTIPAGVASATAALTVLADTTDEPNETVKIGLSNPVGVVLSDTTGVVTILDDDSPAVISIGDVLVKEGDSGTTTATFTVTRSVVTNTAVTVKWGTINGSATSSSGSDFIAVPSTLLSFAAGDLTKTVTVTINGDIAVEPDETFLVKLTSATGGAAFADDTGVGTIYNDD